MREIIGIIAGILGFLLLSSYAVKKYGIPSSSSPKAVRSHPPSHSPPSVPTDPSPPSSVTSPTAEEMPSLQQPGQPPPLLLPSQEKLTEMLTPTVTTPVPAQREPTSSRSGKIIQFQPGCTGLSQRDRTALNVMIPALQKSPGRRITIEGHTDDTGDRRFNQDLSRLRADVVRYYLAAQGIDETRITARGHGSSLPIADNRSAFGRRRNRRADVAFVHDSPVNN